MILSFAEKLNALCSQLISGPELSQTIAAWLTAHTDAQRESGEVLHKWLAYIQEIDASDLDFGAPGANNQVWSRLYGVKSPIPDMEPLSLAESTAIILSILTPAQREKLYYNLALDFSYEICIEEKQLRFRGTVYYERSHLSVNFRRINDFIYTMEELGISRPIAEKMNLRFEKTGLILITGITGSGKSTTLDAIVDMNNRENKGHIVIIGNPIEQVHPSKQCLIRHREVGVDVHSFDHGAIEALRQDPDIIVVGEMRDPATISTVLEITDSGHKTFTTLHTSSAIDSIHRIIAEFPPEEQDRVRNRLADVLSITMSQKLVPTVDRKLVMTKEILAVDASVKAAIRNKNIGEIYQMMVEGKRYGMHTLEQDLLELFKRGTITNTTAMSYANSKKRMAQLLSS
ncbi:MAG: Flp pilus assembly complex ATPase component TadA [Candidatus Cloacimonetes bacterium]|nr:Flp pilus assembly complex ATPase component TadA [Candidatus Cloacimonadota bacterium]